MPTYGPKKLCCRSCGREFVRVQGDLVFVDAPLCSACRAKGIRDALAAAWKKLWPR